MDSIKRVLKSIKEKYNTFNEKISTKTVLVLATMECAYAFIMLCILPLLDPKDQANILYVSNCFQLVFLPIIMYSAARDSKKLAVQQDEDHEEVKEMYNDIKELLIDVKAIANRLELQI